MTNDKKDGLMFFAIGLLLLIFGFIFGAKVAAAAIIVGVIVAGLGAAVLLS